MSTPNLQDAAPRQANPDEEFEEFLKAFKSDAGLSKKDVQEYEETTVDDVNAILYAIQQKHLSNNKQQYLKRLQVFIVNMESFGKVIEVFLNSSNYLGFVWGPMKFMLVTACNYSEAWNSLLDAYLQIGELLPQLQAYQQHCISNDYMRTVLALMYKDILEFHGVALKHFRKPIWKQLFPAFWGGFLIKLRELKEKMERHRHLIESQASITQFEEAQKLREIVETNFQEIQEEFVRRRWPEVHRWLSPYNSNLQQIDCTNAKHESPGSGQWLLSNSRFKEWYDPIYCLTPLLWLYGIPGAGKTTLISTIIEALPNLCSPASIRMAFFYCKGDDPNRNSFVSVARGLLSQLLKENPDLVLHLYEKGNLKSGEAILSDPDMAKELLEIALDSRQTTYIIIDGIDECERQQKKLICSWFIDQVDKLPKEDLGNLRCLFVSRKDGHATKDLGMLPAIELRPIDMQEDVRRYIQAWGRKIEDKHGKIDSERYPWADAIMAGTQGMFLFARLAVQYLWSLPTRQELLENIHPGRFPEEIGELYERILNQIFNQRSHAAAKHKIVSRLLNLLVCVKRPLRWYEIQGFFAFDPDDENEPVDYTARKLREDATELLLSLVVHHADDSVQLVHPTAKEWVNFKYLYHHVQSGVAKTLARHLLRSKYVSETDAELEITEQTFAFLTSPFMAQKLQTTDLRRFLSKGYYSFLDYAVACWVLHLQVVAAVPDLEGSKLDEIAGSLSLFIDTHWAKGESGDSPVSTAMKDKLRVFSTLVCFPKLTQAVISARKQLGIHGKGPSPDEPLCLSQLTMEIRKVHEDSHFNLHEANSLREFYGTNCFKCPRVNCIKFYEGYSTSDERDCHVNKHERPFSCGVQDCSMSIVGYTTEKSLRKHMYELHGLEPGTNVDFPLPPKMVSKQTTESIFSCPQCPKRFTRAFNLRNHMRTHSNSRPFACKVCGKDFPRSNELRRHEAIHGGKREFICRGVLKDGRTWGCNQTFLRGDKLRAHFHSQAGRRCRALYMAELEAVQEAASSEVVLLAVDSDSPLSAKPVETQQEDVEMDDAEWEQLLESMVDLPEDGDKADWFASRTGIEDRS